MEIRDSPQIRRRRRVWDTACSLALRKRPSAAGEREALRPSLGALDLTLIGVGASVGSGIFVIIGVAVQPTGPAVCLSFLIAAISSLFSALCYAELASRIPESGSVYLYAYVAFGEFVAVLFGLNVMMDYHVGAALSVLSCGSYIHETFAGYFGMDAPVPSAKILAAILTVVLTVMLCLGVEEGMRRVNGVLVVTKVLVVIFIVIAGFIKMQTDNLQPFMPFGFWPVASTSATCCFAFIGFGTVANAAEECKNPGRDLPVAITVSLAICAALYVAFALTLCGLVPYAEIDPKAPVVDAFAPQHGNLPWMSVLVDWGAIIGLFTTLLSGLYSQARMYLAMSRDGLLPLLSAVSQRFGTPVRAQLFCGLVATVLAVFVPVHELVIFLNIGVLLSYTVVCAGVLVLRCEKPALAGGMSALLTVSSATGAALLPLSGTGSLWNIAALTACVLSAFAAIGSCVPLFLVRYSVPLTFACPLCPHVPVLGVAVNGYLLAQCSWQAWLRLLVTTLFVAVAYVVRVCRELRKDTEVVRPPCRAEPLC